MNNALFVCRSQRLADLCRDLQRVFEWNWAAPDLFRECFASNELQDQKTRAVRFVDIVDCCDIGMVQRCEHFSFPLKSCQTLRIATEFVRKNLDGDFALQFGVARSVDFAHTALAEQSGDLVRAELCADREGHECRAALNPPSPA